MLWMLVWISLEFCFLTTHIAHQMRYHLPYKTYSDMSTRFVQHNAILYHFIVTSGLVFVAVIARKKRLLDIRMHNLIFQFGPFSMHNPSFAFITNPNFPLLSHLVCGSCAIHHHSSALSLDILKIRLCSFTHFYFHFMNKFQVVIHEHEQKKRQFLL